MRVFMKTNTRNAQKQVAGWAKEKDKDVQKVVNKSALNIQGGARRRVRVDTNRLRSSIGIEPANGAEFSLKVGTKVFYGPYIEWGTGKFANHPTIPGRSTPWAFPVASVKRELGYRRIFVNGIEMYLTHGQKPKPFLLPAFEEEKPKYLAEMRRVLGR